MVQVRQQIVTNTNGDSKHWNILNASRRYSSPNVTVSQDGTGSFRTIMEAVLAAPNYCQERYVIFVKRGVYREYVNVDAQKWNLAMIGEGMHLTVVSGNRSFSDGWDTYHTATFAVNGQGFVAMNMGFENTAGPSKYQAVALRSSADRSAFYRCKISGYQDSLYAHNNRQFYKKCEITGTVDSVFGRGKAVFQNCLIFARRNDVGKKNVITANGRNSSADVSGFSFQFCHILAHGDLAPSLNMPTYLGRPWGMFSRTIFMKSFMSNVVAPQGWLEWNGSYGLDTLFYAEYRNQGPGSVLGGRVKWPGFHVITNSSMANEFTVAQFIQGHLWLPSTGIPYIGGLVG
ncbi:pectinesterase/pectinesterase inhibitor PPE8B-like [Morus notabilis]|nr:pectinesterase/pectinesterase inhibitor PPE8B-like [Morus notabilis]